MPDSIGDTVVPQSSRYLLDPAQFASLRTKMITRMALVGPLFIAGMWYLDRRLRPKSDIFFDFIFLPVMFVWIAYRQIQRERKKWNSMVLELRSDSLVRTLPSYPVLEIVPGDVKKIVESRRGITIQTDSRLRWLFVHRALLGYEDLRSRLAAWAPTAEVVRSTTSLATFILNLASAIVCVGLFGGPLFVMYTPHRELILPLGVVLIIGFTTMILYYRRSPNVPTSFRKTSWILLALPLVAMIIRLI